MSRLKGRNAEKIPKKKKEKMEKTANKMVDTRFKDYVNLRDKAEKRLIILLEEKKKHYTMLQQLQKQEKNLTNILIKLQGAEDELKSLLGE